MATKTPAKKAPAKKAPASPARPKKFENAVDAVRHAIAGFETQAEAARETQVAKSYLSRILSGKTNDVPGPQTLQRLGITRTVVYTVG
jgi:hypothetical protein